MVFVCALGAAIANALTSVFQRMGVEDAPADSTLTLGLLTHALRRGIWLFGFALMLFSFLLQAIALHFGELSEVQPVLTLELLFLVLVLAVWFRFSVGSREYLGALAAGAGLAGFLVFADPRPGSTPPPQWQWALAAAACSGAMVIAVGLALRGPRWWRAALFGTASAIGFAFTAALTKAVGDYFARDWVTIFRHPQTYGLVLFGLASVFLAQNAFHAGPIVASQSTLVLVDPLVSILIGIALFGDNLRTGGAWGPLEAISLLVLFAGAFSLLRSPLVGAVKGDDVERAELLGRRRESVHNPISPPPLGHS
ncbi:MAG TPA: DMT family transporter [Acidimicrobiales bacterium]